MASVTPSSEEELRAQLIEKARSYIGTKWRHQGRTRQGIDCLGLMLVPAFELGLCDYPDQYNYPRRATSRELIEISRLWAQEVRLGPGGIDAMKDGDVLVLRDHTFPQHVGMVTSMNGQRSLLHSSLAHRRVVEEYINQDHRQRALTTFKFRAFT